MSQKPKHRGPCPYCKSEVAFKEKKEHVIPQAFGHFVPNNLIAWDVCAGCNKYFSEELEFVLAHGTYEGLLRYRFELAGDLEPRRIKDRARLAIKSKEESTFGALVFPRVNDEGGEYFEPIRQIGFAAKGSNLFQYFPEWGLPTKEEVERLCDTEDLHFQSFVMKPDEVIAALQEGGFKTPKVVKTGKIWDEPPGVIELDIKAGYDQLVCRAMAKIAFNYLSLFYPSFAAMPNVAKIRDFIRHGTGHWRDFIRMDQMPIISNEPQSGRYLLHVVAVRYSRGKLIGQVSLFNTTRFEITLSDIPLQIVVPKEFLNKAHAFDPIHQQCGELLHPSQIIDHLTIEP